MHLCLCRAISDRNVAAFAHAGACTAAQLFKTQDTRPNYGSCIHHILGALDEARGVRPSPGMAAAD